MAGQGSNGSVMPAPDLMLGMTRNMVVMMQFNEQKQDYINSVQGLQEGSQEYQNALDACHARGAKRCADVARNNAGIYVKAAQFIASIRGGTGDRGIPRQYTEALAVFTDQAPSKPIAVMAEVLKDCFQLGEWPSKELGADCSFRSFEAAPIASASLAQVHRAVLQDGTVVAVKAQYPELRKEMASDFAVFKTMGQQISQMASGYDLMWVVEDFEKYLTRELDFEIEAESAEKTAKQLAHLAPRVYVPKVLRSLSSKRLLTMEFCEGLIKANDPAKLQSLGLDVRECGQLICETFAEMIFVHGRVHADPHAGNIYFRVLMEDGRPRPQLVILDHGLYHDLTENDVREHFCEYWKACCSSDYATVRRIGERFAGALHRFLPVVLSPWFVVSSPDVTLSEILTASRDQLPESIALRDIADFVVATRQGGANLIGLLHSLGYVRGLLNALGFPEGQRIAGMLKFACIGAKQARQSEDGTLLLPDLGRSERTRMWLRMALLSGRIAVVAPFARPLMQIGLRQAPPLWIASGIFAVVLGLGVSFAAKARSNSGSYYAQLLAELHPPGEQQR